MCCVLDEQQWDRTYFLTKTRLLWDLTHDNYNEAKPTSMQSVMLSLLGRRGRKGRALPQIEPVEDESKQVVGQVLEKVVCQMKSELFMELMEMMW